MTLLTCADCPRPYGDEHGFPDLIVPDDVWAQIAPRPDGGGMLCPSCLLKRLADLGLEKVPAAFTSGPCGGSGGISPIDYDRRVTELLEANNRLLERARFAEKKNRESMAALSAAINLIRGISFLEDAK